MGCFSKIIDVFSPPLCPFCHNDIRREGHMLCAACESQLPSLPEKRCVGCGGPNDGLLDLCPDCIAVSGGRPWNIAVSAFPFFGNVRHAIHRYKYRKAEYLAEFFGQSMAEAWRMHGSGSVDLISYIPLHWMRYLDRGYNQAGLLAAQVGKVLGLEVAVTLRRKRRTRQQARLGQTGRMANMRGVFAPRDSKLYAGCRMLLIDDVFTTGSTLSEATRVLLNAGAASVSVLTLARD